MVKSYNIIGYVVLECETVCPDCFSEFKEEKKKTDPNYNDYRAIFADSEWDYTPSCVFCNEEIEVNLIDRDYLINKEAKEEAYEEKHGHSPYRSDNKIENI